MHAVVLRAFGDPDVLQLEVQSDPVAGPGEVVVAVELASVTFVETQVRAGRPPNPAMLPTLPAVLGNGVGGTVVAVGDGVDRDRLGARVVTTTGGSGGYAELVAVDADALVEVPPTLGLTDATALLADGRTAVGLVDAAAVRPGDTVLVEAAAGGVGSLLVQLARRAGARVVAVAGGARKAAVAAELGADRVVDSSDPSWSARVRDAVDVIDVVFDGVGGELGRAALALLADGGRFVPFGMASGAFTPVTDDELARRRLTVVRMEPRDLDEMNALTRRALAAAVAGHLHPVVGQTFPLERAADAHVAIETRATIGKTLLQVHGESERHEP
jgi:NADPH2:quinone reductase